MRVASRVVGAVLALAGLVFVGLSVFLLIAYRPESVLEESDWVKHVTGGLFVAALGVGLILEGWHFLRLDVHKPDEAHDPPDSRFAPYFLAHRREFKVIAQIGLVISLIRLGAACYGVDWPGRWARLPLFVVWLGLAIIGSRIATRQTAWDAASERLRPVLKLLVKAGAAAFFILALLFEWSEWSHHQSLSFIVEEGFPPLFFAWEALFFAYGPGNTVKS